MRDSPLVELSTTVTKKTGFGDLVIDNLTLKCRSESDPKIVLVIGRCSNAAPINIHQLLHIRKKKID